MPWYTPETGHLLCTQSSQTNILSILRSQQEKKEKENIQGGEQTKPKVRVYQLIWENKEEAGLMTGLLQEGFDNWCLAASDW